MDLSLDVMDHSGHTELSFTEDHVRVHFEKITARERMMVENVFKVALERGLKAHTADKDGGPGKRLKALPALMAQERGDILFVGDLDSRMLLAKDLVESEIERRRIVMELQADNTWKVLRKEEFKLTDKKQKVTSTAPIGGG